MPKATGTKAPPPGGTLQLDFYGDVEGTTWQATQFAATGGDSTSDPEDLDFLLQAIYALYAKWIIGPFSGTDLHFHEVWGHLFSSDGERLRHRKAGTAVGEVTGPLAPAQVATLIRWESETGHNGGQPLTYVPGVPMAHLADVAHFLPAVVADLSAKAKAYLDDINQLAAGSISFVRLVDMSFVTAGAYRLVPLGYPITGATVRTVPATQRRRVDREA